MKLLRIINKDRLFIRDDFTFNEETEIGLDVEASQRLYQPKWNFELQQWEESATQEYIDSLKQPTPEAAPSIEQRVETIENIIVEILEV